MRVNRPPAMSWKSAVVMTKILLVEDSKFLRMATERALVRAGYIVCTGADGAQAMELARKEKPKVILLDMLLPKMTGPDVLKKLKKDPLTAGIAVVAFTGLSQKNAARLKQDGTSAFLDKSLGLDKGCETLLASLAEIFHQLNWEVPSGARSNGAWGLSATQTHRLGLASRQDSYSGFAGIRTIRSGQIDRFSDSPRSSDGSNS